MKQGSFIVVALIIATGLLRWASPAPSSTSDEKPQLAAKKEPPKPGASSSSPPRTSPDPDMANAITDFLGVPLSLKPQTSSGNTSGPSQAMNFDGIRPEDIRFAIAFLPDPIHTHLALFFDRSIDVIEQAVQKQGCSFDRATMPWDPGEHAESSSAAPGPQESKATSDRRAWPGLMIFRRPEKATGDSATPCDKKHLFLFVVAETPTGGIRKDQFQEALKTIRLIRSSVPTNVAKDDRLYLLGPTFSGSLFSLSVALQENLEFMDTRNVTVYSGTITGTHSQKWFTEWAKGYTTLQIGFASFQADDDTLIESFVLFAIDRGYKPGEIAILSEDETDFGATTGPKEIVKLHFPREISQLRAAYQPLVATSSAPSAATPQLPLDLQTSGNDDDSVSEFAKSQTPLSQEAIMLGLATELHKRHTKLVLLRATDPLDQLFVAQYLRRAYPPARVGVTAPDLLFAREGDGLLHGTFAVSAYSLAPEAGADLLEPADVIIDRKEDHVFASSLTEGLYNATIGVLASMSQDPAVTCSKGQDIRIPAAPYVDYAPPANMSPGPDNGLAPVVRVTTLARDGYWAVASLPPSVSSRPTSALAPQDAKPKALQQSGRTAPRVPMSFNFATLVIGLLALVHLWFSFFGSILSRWEGQAQFACALPAQGCSPREGLLAIGALLLTGGFIWVCVGRAVALETGSSLQRAGVIFMAAAAVAFGILTTYDLAIRRKSPIWATLYAILSSVIFLNGLAVAILQPAAFDWLWSSRSVHLTNGSSAFLPMLILLAGGYWWVWYGLRGMVLTDAHRPRLPEGNDLPASYIRLRDGDTYCLRRLASPLSFSKEALVAITVGTFLFFITPDAPHPIQTLEGKLFEWGFFLLLAGGNALLLWTLVKLVTVWGECRRLLGGIDRTPIRDAFARLDGFDWAALWTPASSSLRETYRYVGRQLEGLHRLAGAITQNPMQPVGTVVPSAALRAQIAASIAAQAATIQKIQAALDSPRDSRQPLSSYHVLQLCTAKTAGMLVTEVLEPQWNDSALPVAATAPKFVSNLAWQSLGSKLKLVAEEFVALGYAYFLSTVMVRMRSLVVAAIGIYVALLISISVYPFEPNPALFSIGVVLFVISGGAVVYVYVQMHKDPALSRLTSTKEGQLDPQFWFQIIGAGAIPLLTLLAGQVPVINQFVVSLLQPTLQALK
jgi:hypothetical protein